MKKFVAENWKQALMSIFIGAVVAFLSSFFEGALQFLKNHGNDIAGGALGALHYISKHIKTA